MSEDEQCMAPIDPLEIEIVFRAAQSNYDDKVQSLLDDITKLGRNANSLVPEIVRSFEKYRPYIREELLIRLYEETKNRALLDLMNLRAQQHPLSLWGKAKLLEAGVVELEEEIIDAVKDNFCDMRPETAEAINALGKVGSNKAYRTLVLLGRMLEEKIKAATAEKQPQMDSEPGHLRGLMGEEMYKSRVLDLPIWRIDDIQAAIENLKSLGRDKILKEQEADPRTQAQSTAREDEVPAPSGDLKYWGETLDGWRREIIDNLNRKIGQGNDTKDLSVREKINKASREKLIPREVAAVMHLIMELRNIVVYENRVACESLLREVQTQWSKGILSS